MRKGPNFEVKLSQFVDKQDERTLWSHEESFRRKTRNVVNTVLEKQKKEKELVLPLLNNVGSDLGKTGIDVMDLEKKIAKTLLTTTTGSHVPKLIVPEGLNPTHSGQKPQTIFGSIQSQMKGANFKKPGK